LKQKHKNDNLFLDKKTFKFCQHQYAAIVLPIFLFFPNFVTNAKIALAHQCGIVFLFISYQSPHSVPIKTPQSSQPRFARVSRRFSSKFFAAFRGGAATPFGRNGNSNLCQKIDEVQFQSINI
jgi:hypothetical protein